MRPKLLFLLLFKFIFGQIKRKNFLIQKKKQRNTGTFTLKTLREDTTSLK